ncbi:hypothetical protein HN388_08030 [bacterium]|nr:hypothetical protein [bacterium]
MFNKLLITILILVLASSVFAVPRKDMVADAGIIGLAITNLGYIGNGLSNPNQSSCEYPLNSNVEHLFLGGLWVGAIAADGTIHVSTGAQDVSNLVAGDESREFEDTDDQVLIMSNIQNSNAYNPASLATKHIECYSDDYAQVESGNHTPLGLKVILRALSWGSPYADDFVILDYAIINISGGELRDVYVGLWTDTTIGNTEITNPYDGQGGAPWNYYDDANGGWQPGDVEGDPNIWMSYEHDDDGDDNMCTSWVSNRLLGTVPSVEPYDSWMPPVSYNAWTFRDVPGTDDRDTTWTQEGEIEEIAIGKYQLMGNGLFCAGETQEEDYTAVSDWITMMSTGPFRTIAPDDTVHVTFAITCGADSLSLLANSKVAQVAYDQGFDIPAGPPSPQLELSYDTDSVILSWTPGVDVDQDGNELISDDPLRSPEHHISKITARPDFQGYRIFRYRGETFGGDPYVEATLVAQFDKIDGIGFDTGLPELSDGKRVFIDSGLLDGFAYWYSIVSFSAPDVIAGLPEFQSGFYENALLVFPGPAPAVLGSEMNIGVFPNPYRASSLYDNRYGEKELGRKIWFTGLPESSTIKVYNLSGDLVRTLQHNSSISGMEPWDLLSEPTRAIASGLYIYVVEDLRTGDIARGKLVIIK